ncbi:uncharacterized protein L203_103545 [Cryptococcus depauperatus CBS 7841]|uniref:Uncharacterized protein n=1 Tax=Cryptococcus depauperatus CBS 7841 TaxID=1295531 RepID=A0AAJ8JTT8_9TREE
MSSLQIGSSYGSQALTQHGPSQSHFPAPLISSQTRKGGSKPQDGYKKPSDYLNERGCTTSPTSSGIRSKIIRLHSDWVKARGWKDGTGNGQGQYIIDHAPINRHVGVERDAMDNVRIICPEWDILYPIFNDRNEISYPKDRRKWLS